MILEEYAKEKIQEGYGSVRNFASQIGMPYSTLMSGLTRGLKTMTLENANLVLDALDLWPEFIQPVTNETEPRREKHEILEDNLLAAYVCITVMGADPEKAYTTAIKEAEKECGQSLEAYQALIPNE